MKPLIIIRLIIINTLLSVSFQSNLLQVLFYREYSDYEARIKVGTPSSYFYISIDTSINFTWVTSVMYSYSKSQTAQVIDQSSIIHYNNLSIPGIEVVDVVQLDKKEEITVYDFNVFVISDILEENKGIGGIGLAYKFSNDSYSIVHQIKRQGLISSLSFSLVHIEYNQGYLYFGGIPDYIVNNTHSSICKVNNDDTKGRWGCKLTQIQIGNVTYINEDYSYFDSSSRFIFTPSSFFNRLYEVYLADAFKNNKCSFLFDVDFHNLTKCDYDIIDTFGNITFVFGNYMYTFISRKLFNCNYSQCYFSILPNPHKKSGQFEWIFGLQFMDQYHMLFNYETSLLTFYSKEEALKLSKEETELLHKDKAILRLLIQLSFLILLIGFLFNLYVFKYKLNTN